MLAFWLSVVWCDTTLAESVSDRYAQKLVEKWLAKNDRAMGSQLGSEVGSVKTFTDTNSQPVYYVVYLRPRGFVIVSADDLVEPIVCFSSGASYNSSDRNPLGALVRRDLPARVSFSREVQKKVTAGSAAGGLTKREEAVRKSGETAFAKWRKLLTDTNSPSITTAVSTVSDIRVSPLLQTEWGQDVICGNKACYNYYTPPGIAGSTDNYYCGCTATAMAQYMRFCQYPTEGVGTGCYQITVRGRPQTACLRGGDGSGGAYNWSEMTLVPDCDTTLTQRQAIGALAYDAGVAAKMDYEADGSGAYISDAASALVNTFGYGNAIYGYNNNYNIGDGLNGMINPNLDYGNPVILGISNFSSGHAIVADGYGYQSSTLYHHLNLGWDGDDDVWYNLPNIDSSPSFDTVDTIIYNIYTIGTGEIISGRVTVTGYGTPVAGATVTAIDGSGTYSAPTNSKGVYAIAKVPSNSTYTVSVTASGYTFTSQTVSTDQSRDSQAVSGNCWAVDFTAAAEPQPPVTANSEVSVEKGVSQSITLEATDDGQPNPPGTLEYIITSLPAYGTLSDPCGDDINSVPYTLLSDGNNVIYTSESDYTGSDAFEFIANDGGTSPTGGDSNTATVSITVQSSLPQAIYETSFDTGLPDGWTIVHGGSGSSTDTWRSDNPGGRSSANWTGVFMIVDSDYAWLVNMDEQLITQSIDCTRKTDVKLEFNHEFYHYSNEIGDVDVRVDGGRWQNMVRYQGADYGGSVELSLSDFGANGSSDVQIRWHYYKANYDYYWGIDDVQIIASDAVPTVAVNKCSVAAGRNNNSDKISFSGTMNATASDFNDSNDSNVIVTIDSNDMVSPCVLTFPINNKTFKKGHYRYSGTENGVKKSFKYNLKTGKFTFAASNVDLSGLGCPLTVEIKIGDYIGTTDVNEAIVNGPKKLIPINLMR